MDLRRFVHGEETDRERRYRESQERAEREAKEHGPVNTILNITDYLGR